MTKHEYPFLRPLDFYQNSGMTLVGVSAFELRWRFRDHRIRIGRATYGDCTIVLYSAEDRVEIGNYTSIASHTILLAGGEHNYRSTSSYPFRVLHRDDPGALISDPTLIRYQGATYKGPLRIGSDVWIGLGALIMSGVTVGHGSVIGAGAVVASDVPPYSIVVGNPGRILKKRFDDDIIRGLLESRWWDWDPKWIRHHQDLLFGDPAGFLDALSAIDSNERDMYLGNDPSYDQPETDLIPKSLVHTKYRLTTMLRDICPPILLRRMGRMKRVFHKRQTVERTS